jgi:hypothetical protein
MSFVESFPACPPLLQATQTRRAELASGAFYYAYGIWPAHADALIRQELQRAVITQTIDVTQKNPFLGTFAAVLARIVPLRRWVEIFASANEQSRDVFPPVSLTSNEVAYRFLWTILLRTPELEEDWNCLVCVKEAVKLLFDVERFPLRVKHGASAAVLLEELHHSNARKVKCIQMLVHYKNDSNISSDLWLREKHLAPWWAARAANPAWKDQKEMWLALGRPVAEASSPQRDRRRSSEMATHDVAAQMTPTADTPKENSNSGGYVDAGSQRPV